MDELIVRSAGGDAMTTVGSLCSGYEATGLGLTLAGWNHRLAFVADPDPAAAKALAHHHPGVPNLGDITAVDWSRLERVDVLTAGFPCSDISCAGRRAGLAEDVVIPAGVMPCGCPWADHRILDCVAHDWWGGSPAWNCEQGLIDQAAASVDWLNEQDLEGDGPPPERVVKGTRSGVWAHVRRCINELRPRLVLIENVAALLSTPANRSTDGADGDVEPGPAGLGKGSDRPVLRAAGAVLGDLADLGYDAVWQVVSAAEVGAPHLRKRVFIFAWPAADPPRFGHGDTGPAGVGGVPAAAVAGGTGAGELSLLPTPRTSDTNGVGGHGAGGLDLRTAVSLLPTPKSSDVKRNDSPGERARKSPALGAIGALLPTPTVADGTKDGPNQRGSSGDLMLPSAVVQLLPTPMAADGGLNRGSSAGFGLRNVSREIAANALLPTPTVADARGSRNATSGRRDGAEFNSGTTLSDVAHADRWGEYAPAIARWEQAAGRPAPDPTEPGRNGQPRLAPAFVEWMQGLPAGYITAVPGVSRNDALRLLGNANPPQQYAAAITQLAAIVAHITARDVAA